MNRYDLKSGDVVVLRSGVIGVVIGGVIATYDNCFYIRDYNNELCNIGLDSAYSVDKIYGSFSYGGAVRLYCDLCKLKENNEEFDDYKKYLRWERENEINWGKIKPDTKVICWNNGMESEKKNRYFAEYKDGKIYTYPDGASSWSYSNDSRCLTIWDHVELSEKGKNHG